ncbi:MAG: type II toxin-antitoxin system HicA family toxin [Candidatus Eremiobacteraeota bacterium]|nr:type II toxin-antitoxin system HicA family toxin [Candidatus Eremiobacteraeota bacterium]
MSARLPTVSAKALTQALLRAGFIELRQRGSHRIFALGSRRAIVPMHGGDLKPGTLKAILDASGLTPDRLRELL